MLKGRRQFLIRGGKAAGLCAVTVPSAGAGRARSAREALRAGSSSNCVLDPTCIDPRLDSRSISFENPTGARGGTDDHDVGRRLDEGEGEDLLK